MHSDQREVENCNHCRIVFSGAEVLGGAMPRFEWALGLRLRSMTLYAPLPMGFENIRRKTQEMGIGGMLLLGSFADWVREARSWVV
jgi:hypothetical protein